MRLFSFFFAILLPAFYISVISFYSEIVLKDLVFQIKGSVEQVPYPPLIEVLFMKLTIELIRETGLQLSALALYQTLPSSWLSQRLFRLISFHQRKGNKRSAFCGSHLWWSLLCLVSLAVNT
ncbi:spore germination protein [Domibacillus sp. DTU_2020_1001157_1_SI_ALB_TIR_016]|uniref:spore germination protein n=1 Tax=Domibacillus sp. DTU_2020_1001157_1_SI_ALB_TIR_016 TaxID=3077789 RepID=UPI00397764FB